MAQLSPWVSSPND